MKTEPKADPVLKLSLYKNQGTNQHPAEPRPCELHEAKHHLPKIGQAFMNVSTYGNKFRDSK